jgi:hypothetical protein
MQLRQGRGFIPSVERFVRIPYRLRSFTRAIALRAPAPLNPTDASWAVQLVTAPPHQLRLTELAARPA